MTLSKEKPDWDEVRERLAEMDSERLAEELVEIARGSAKVADRVLRLAASRRESLLRFQAKLGRFKSSERLVSWNEAGDFADRLRALLADLRKGEPDSEQGIEMLSEFSGMMMRS